MDTLIGIVGAVVIAHWSLVLLRSSGAVLLDTVVADTRVAARIKERLEVGTDRVTDPHLCVWDRARGSHRSDRQRSTAIGRPVQGAA
jgi:Co/Zn/Cd efflux system component